MSKNIIAWEESLGCRITRLPDFSCRKRTYFTSFRTILFLYGWTHRRNLANNHGGGGGTKRPGILGTSIYERVKLEGEEELTPMHGREILSTGM
jgi:hypothetical protein